MEITLEKIELVKDRTGVSYKEAKEALEAAEGSVVDAIIAIEENLDDCREGKVGSYVSDMMKKIKELVNKGNISKISVVKDDELIINIPVNVGIIGAVIAPWGVVAAAIAALGFKCRVELTTDEGKIIDLSEKAGKVAETVKEKSNVVFDEIKDKAPDSFDKFKEAGTDFYNSVKEKAPDSFDKFKEAGTDFYNSVKDKAPEVYDKVKDASTDAFNTIKEKAPEVYNTAKEVSVEKFNELKEKRAEKNDFDIDIDIDLDEEDIKNNLNS